MQSLTEELILSICFFVETKDLPSVLLINHHWIDVSKYEVLWKFHYTKFLLHKSLQNEKNSKKIKYYKERYKSQMDETLNLFERQKYLEKKQNSDELSSDLFVGDRYYTIFKKEVIGVIISKYNSYLNKLLATKINLKTLGKKEGKIGTFMEFKEIIENSLFFNKWKDILQFLNSKITKPFCDDTKIDQYNFIYLRSSSYVDSLITDLYKILKFERESSQFHSNEELELSQEYIRKITSFIISLFISTEPIVNNKELVNETTLEWVKASSLAEELNIKPFYYSIDLGFNVVSLLDIKDVSLFHYLITEMDKDLNNNGNKRFLSFNNLDYNLSLKEETNKKSKDKDQSLNVLKFSYDLFLSTIINCYGLPEIERLLTFINNNFKELKVNENIPKELFNDNQMNSKLCYFLYNHKICDKSEILQTIFVHSYDLTKKAILEWKFTHTNFLYEIINTDFYNPRPFKITDEQSLELFKLYKNVNPTISQIVIQDLQLFSKKLSLETAKYLIKELANNIMIEKGITDEKEAIKFIVNYSESNIPILFLHCAHLGTVWEMKLISEAFKVIEYLLDCGAIPIFSFKEEVNSRDIPVLAILSTMFTMVTYNFKEQPEDTITTRDEKKDELLLPFENMIYKLVDLGADTGKSSTTNFPVYEIAGSNLSFAMKGRLLKKFILEYGFEHNPTIDGVGTTLFDCEFLDVRFDDFKTINGKALLEEMGILKQ